MSCSGNLVWDVNKRSIGYNEPNLVRINYLGKKIMFRLNYADWRLATKVTETAVVPVWRLVLNSSLAML